MRRVRSPSASIRWSKWPLAKWCSLRKDEMGVLSQNTNEPSLLPRWEPKRSFLLLKRLGFTFVAAHLLSHYWNNFREQAFCKRQGRKLKGVGLNNARVLPESFCAAFRPQLLLFVISLATIFFYKIIRAICLQVRILRWKAPFTACFFPLSNYCQYSWAEARVNTGLLPSTALSNRP